MVEWKKLGEVCAFSRGRTITAKDAVDGDIPVIAGGQTPSYYHNESNREGESITVAGSGAYAGFVSYWNKPIFVSDAFTVDPSQSIKHKYLFQWLKMNQNRIFETQKGAGVPHVHGKDIANFLIPIPSLEEQTRIVGILDTFTSAIDNLKEQIAQRRKQYEYYRDQLLDLEGKPGVEMKFITEVAKSFTGLTYKPENVSDSGTLVLRSSNINDDVLSFDDNIFVQMVIPERAKVQENDILICVRNGSKRLVGKSAMITKEAEGMAFGAFMTILRSFAINSKFLFYVWQSEKVRRQYKGDEAMPIAQITAKDFQRIVIPVPSLSEQKRIVSILDTFEASIQNLEAQLKQREKQYEYYRNKLLTFE